MGKNMIVIFRAFPSAFSDIFCALWSRRKWVSTRTTYIMSACLCFLFNIPISYQHILTVFSLSSLTSMASYPVFHRWGLRCHVEFLPFFDFPMISTQDRPQMSEVHFFSNFICQSRLSKGNQRNKNHLGTSKPFKIYHTMWPPQWCLLV